MTHYRRGLKGKDVLAPIDRKDKFWAKVTKTDSCWLWGGYVSPKGYSYSGSYLAHRLAYEWTHGAIPAGMLLDHICHNRQCVNPDHLRIATGAQNSQNRGGAARTSKSGVRGVYWQKREQSWRADATVNGKRRYLGSFTTLAEAAVAVAKWRRANMPASLMDQERRTFQ